jgi:hypothetical protein
MSRRNLKDQIISKINQRNLSEIKKDQINEEMEVFIQEENNKELNDIDQNNLEEELVTKYEFPIEDKIIKSLKEEEKREKSFEKKTSLRSFAKSDNPCVDLIISEELQNSKNLNEREELNLDKQEEKLHEDLLFLDIHKSNHWYSSLGSQIYMLCSKRNTHKKIVTQERKKKWYHFLPRLFFFLLGIVLAIPFMFDILSPGNINISRCMATLVMTATWWIFEPIPIAIASLTPCILYPMFGILTASEVSGAYFNDTIFLLLASCIIAICKIIF